MSEQYITSTHIAKLGHNLLEVRERALKNIVSKLKIGLPLDNAFARSKEILVKCFDWFTFADYSSEDIILELIKDTVQSEAGAALISHFGSKTIINKLRNIRLQISGKHIVLIDDIIMYLKNKDNVVVPPLISEVPLSYRSENENFINIPVESTATPIDGYIYSRGCDNEQQSGLPQSSTQKSTSRYFHLSEDVRGDKENAIPYYTFCWQPLVTTDRHVLESVETSLRNPDQPSRLLQTCHFFMDVMLCDFPPEVFLQRPTILKELEKHFLGNTAPKIKLAIANCFLKFTQILLRRIHYYSDPATHNLRQYKQFFIDRYDYTNLFTSNYKKKDVTEVITMKCTEMPTPVYCLQTLLLSLDQFLFITQIEEPHEMRTEQFHIFLVLIRLIENLVLVTSHSFTEQVWTNHRNNPDNCLWKLIHGTLDKFAVVICNIFLNIINDDFPSSLYMLYIGLIVSFLKFLKQFAPLDKTHIPLAGSVKRALSTIISDMTLMFFYPKLHEAVLQYAQVNDYSFGDFIDFLELQSIHNSIIAAVKILKSIDIPRSAQTISDIKDTLKSLRFHKNLSIIDIFFDVCCTSNITTSMQDDITDILLFLLSNKDIDIKSRIYCLCMEKITTVMGPTRSVLIPTNLCVDFMLKGPVFSEIILNGLSSENVKISQAAENILLITLKCFSTVSENLWNRVVELILLTFPALACFGNMTTRLGETVMDIIDPDRAQLLGIELNTVFKGNLTLLFSPQTAVRNEAVSRLCWLLSLQPHHKKLLPRLNNISIKSFSNLCCPKYCIDVNRDRERQNYYQPSNVDKVLQLLDSHSVEPVIRRSALTQLSVMTEDYSLHNAFLEADGVTKIVAILQKALVEDCYEDYPDSVIPAIAILKNLALHSSSVRQTLYVNSEALYFILRAMLLYSTDDRLLTDGSILIFLAIFNDYIKGSPTQGNLSLPPTILRTLQIPFTCSTEIKNNHKYYSDVIDEDKQFLFSVKLMWNLVWYDGQKEITSWKKPKYDRDFSEALHFTDSELLRIQNTTLEYSINQCFDHVQTCAEKDDAIIKLSGYTHLYQMLSMDYLPNFDLFSSPWEATFENFLRTEPSSQHDVPFLLHLFECLQLVVPLYKMFGKQCWISDCLTDCDNPLLSILKKCDNQYEDSKELRKELFALITTCVQLEQHYFEFYEDASRKVPSFLNVIDIIAECLKHEDVQGFYNLALLDSILSCLVNLTASLGWSRQNFNNFNKHISLQLACSLCELIGTFHCGKGQCASESVMGLSISRNSILALNHLLMEMHFWNMDNWDTCFTEEGSGIRYNLLNLFLLYTSRDVIVRASTFQLFTGLFLSINCIDELIEGFKERDYCDMQELLICVLLDEDEASLVKEHISNAICSYIVTLHKFNVDILNDLLNVIDRKNVYKKIATATELFYLSDKLCVDNEQYFNHFFAMNADNKSEDDCYASNETYILSMSNSGITTVVGPGYMKSLASLLLHMLQAFPSNVITYITEHQIVKYFLRLLSIPNIKISTTRDMALYCNIMEMNIAISGLAIEILKYDHHRNSLISSKSCIGSAVSLLNVDFYCTKLSQLLYLRNKLRTNIFHLLAGVFHHLYKEEQNIRTFEGLMMSKINQPYLQCLCKSINSNEFPDLQESALKNLTSLLAFHDETFSSQSLIRTGLDDVKIQIVELVSYALEDLENIPPKCQINLLASETRNCSNELPKAGAELCKLLLHILQFTNINPKKSQNKRKDLVLNALTGIVCVSLEAKRYALKYGGILLVIKQLKELNFKLSLEPLDSLKKSSSKKRIAPVFTELGDLLRFLNNLAVGCESVKIQLTKLGLSDIIHKLWKWICAIPNLLLDTLKMLCTFTTDCLLACDSLCMTNATAGSGPKKITNTISLLNSLMDIVSREMDLVSKIHDLTTIKLCFHLLQNCCYSTECRMTIVKSNLLRGSTKLHPYVTKRQKQWEPVQLLWLDFLKTFTTFPEGQTVIVKFPELLPIFTSITSNGTKESKMAALIVLQNISSCTTNRPRLLVSGEYLQVLSEKLTSGTMEEQLIIVSILWFLAANNQRAKLVLKCSGLDTKLHDTLQAIHMSNKYDCFDHDELRKMHYVLNILRNNDK